VQAENLTIINEPAANDSRIHLRNVHDVVIRKVTVKGLRDGVEVVESHKSSDVKLEGVTINGRESGK
jgi:hypothetical protein